MGARVCVQSINVNAILPGFFPTKMTRATIKMLGEVCVLPNDAEAGGRAGGRAGITISIYALILKIICCLCVLIYYFCYYYR